MLVTTSGDSSCLTVLLRPITIYLKRSGIEIVLNLVMSYLSYQGSHKGRTAHVHRALGINLQVALLLCLMAIVASGLQPAPAVGQYNPEHPEVKKLVERGLTYLAGKSHRDMGGRALIGLAFIKGKKIKDHPKISEAVAEIKRVVNEQGMKVDAEGPVYSVGVSIIFLCELDAVKYEPEIQKMLDWLIKNQKGHGGWGYPHRETGDTSMTQYAVLSMWTAKRKGFSIPDENVVRVCNWLMRTQDPSGGWGYQGVDPGSFNRVPQQPVTPSLTAAGTGSLYICGDLLGIRQQKAEVAPDLPPGLQRVEKPEDRQRNAALVDPGRFNSSTGGGNNWFKQVNGINDQIPWVYYYMYALERYMSFYEYAQYGKHQEQAAWYNTGIEFLKKSITSDNCWVGESGPEAATAFAILFMVRSTRDSIEKAQKPLGGELAGGKGLKGALDTARVNSQGKIVTEEESKGALDSVDELVQLLGDKKFDVSIDAPPKIELPDDSSERERQLEKLRELVRAEKFEARLIAVKALVAERSLDNAPILIYALTDPDNRVAIEARNGLRFLSRKFDGFGMPDNPTEAQRATAAGHWRAWYYALRPEAEEREEIVLP